MVFERKKHVQLNSVLATLLTLTWKISCIFLINLPNNSEYDKTFKFAQFNGGVI